MDAALLWTIVGVVVSVIALAVTIVIAVVTVRRQFPKRRLSFVMGETRLVSGTVPLEVSYRGKGVRDPRVIELSIVSDSRADIPSSAFDAGRPIILELSVPIVTVLERSVEGIQLHEHGRALVLEPQLIRVGAASDLTLLVEGPSGQIVVDNSLIDIPVREVGDVGDLWSSGRGRQTVSLWAGMVSISVVAGVLAASAVSPAVAVIGWLANHLVTAP